MLYDFEYIMFVFDFKICITSVQTRYTAPICFSVQYVSLKNRVYLSRCIKIMLHLLHMTVGGTSDSCCEQLLHEQTNTMQRNST